MRFCTDILTVVFEYLHAECNRADTAKDYECDVYLSRSKKKEFIKIKKGTKNKDIIIISMVPTTYLIDN